MIAIILLAIALAMDAFAVSISLGAKHSSNHLTLALLLALYFGAAQGVMPFIGYLLGIELLTGISQYLPIIACGILLILGSKMLWEAYQDEDHNINEDVDKVNSDSQVSQREQSSKIRHATLFAMAIATSIDAMGAGLTLPLLGYSPIIICLLIAIITGVLSFLGVYLGNLFGDWLESKAEILGGVILILLGIKMVI